MTNKIPERKPLRRVVRVEYDVTDLTAEQVDELLFDALTHGRDVSFKIEITPGVANLNGRQCQL